MTGCSQTQVSLVNGQRQSSLHDAIGRELDHRVIASPETCPCGRETLREKPRKSSGPGSGKSGDRLPEGAGVSSHANEGRQCEISVLKFGFFSPAVFNFRSKR